MNLKKKKKAYLHYACEYNMPMVAKRILQLNGKLDAKDRKNSNRPLHLICQNSNIEALKKYYRYRFTVY